ncbi:MAG: hypothetical protein NTX11_00465 [Candidatus Saccharibacteria bacterium]|nr:hypothetical protein [Candidatus Saccharibacteria bacterium]
MLKRILSGLGATVLSLSSLFVFAPMIASAAVDVCTWTGATNSSWNTAANWSCATDGAAVPGAGDSLVFPSGTGVTNRTLNNDITAGTSFASITFSGTTANNLETDYTLAGNSIAITTGIINTSKRADNTGVQGVFDLNIEVTSAVEISVLYSSSSVLFSGVISGSGNITKVGPGAMGLYGSNTFTGTFLAEEGIISAVKPTAFGASSAGSTFNDAAQLNLFFYESDKLATINEPFTLNGTTRNSQGSVVVSTACGYSECSDSNITFAGAIVLGADVKVSAYGTVTITGALSGSHTIMLLDGEYGTLVINSSSNTSSSPNGTTETPATTTKYEANSPQTDISLKKNETATVTGTYQSGFVTSKSTLKGTGTFKGSLTISEGGTVAPGMSPGCISSGDLTVFGTYQAEIAGVTPCTLHDQMKVTGTVTLSQSVGTPLSGTLSASIINGYKLVGGEKFTIIDNDAADKVVGTFKDLAEGATFKTASGTVLKISYVGGDGNDVTLTVVSVGVPDTGFSLLMNNPAIILSVAVAAAGAILIMSRRLKPATKRSRR